MREKLGDFSNLLGAGNIKAIGSTVTGYGVTFVGEQGKNGGANTASVTSDSNAQRLHGSEF